MNGNHRMLLRSCRTLMAMGALVLLLVAVSHAKQSLDQVISQQLDTTTGLVVDARKKDKDDRKKDKDDRKKDKDDRKSVPEPSASVLLLLGLGVTGLGGYCVERRKRVA